MRDLVASASCDRHVTVRFVCAMATRAIRRRGKTMRRDGRRRRRRVIFVFVSAMGRVAHATQTRAVERLARAIGYSDVVDAIARGADACDGDGMPGIWCRCDGDRGCGVEVIRASGKGLTGSLPRDLERASLDALRTLDLSSNAIRGEIPETFFEAMPNLRELYLNLNVLDGPLPRSVGNLKSLEVLNIDGGYTAAQIVIEPFVPPDLRNVYGTPGTHFGNQLSGEIPEEIGNLSRLRVLNLHRNTLGRRGQSYALPHSIGNLQRLEYIDVSGNYLYGSIPPELATLPALRQLNLDDNQMSGPIPADWSQASELESLVLEGNLLSGTLPEALPRNLTFLDLHENELTGSVNVLSRFKRLEIVLLDRNLFSGSIALSKQTNPNLKTISLANNPGLCGVTPDDVLPIATQQAKDIECDKPAELCQLWPEKTGTSLGIACRCSANGEVCLSPSSAKVGERCCELGTCVDQPYKSGTKVCVGCSTAFQRCGGKLYDGPTCCKDGLKCVEIDSDRSECWPCAPTWAQCGGELYDGPRCCANVEDSCQVLDRYYSQCRPI
jgi:hypothetical protein